MIFEDEEKYEKPSHLSYKEYKKKLESNPNEGLILFVSAFFVMLLIFLGVAKQLSPDVDVSIGDNTEYSQDDLTRGNVDDRLKLIQMEDNSNDSETQISDDPFSSEMEEKVIIPKQSSKDAEAADVITLDSSDVSNVEEKKATQPISAKVVVGYYATPEQAEVAKSIIMESGMNIQPFVKNMGSAYTLQVGSFSSKETAQSVANELLKNNFPARVIIE